MYTDIANCKYINYFMLRAIAGTYDMYNQAGADLGEGFPYHSSGLLISQLSLMVTINFYHPLV